jgi:type I restriction enzyme S subunit
METAVENKVGYKKTKLGWIPEDWEVLNVSDVFDFLSTNSLSRSQMNYSESDGCLYNIHYGDIHATYSEPILDLDKCKQVPVVNDDVLISSSISYLKEGDIVMADASEDYAGVGATIELSNVNNKKIVAGLHTLALRDKLGVTAQGYRAYLLKHPKVSVSVKVIATGSKVYGISKSNLLKISLVLPPLPEQQKIATILSTWDKAIEKLTQLIAAKEQRKKGLMQLLLTGKKRFTGFTEEWKEVKLGKVYEIVGGGTPDTTNLSYWNGEIQWFTPTEIKSKYVSKSIRTISEAGLAKSSAKLLPIGSLLFTSRATIGDVGITKVECTTNQGFQSFLPSEKGDIAYLYYWIKENRNEFIRRSSGSTFLEISKKEIEKIKIKLPPRNEQQKIASTLSGADKEIELLKQELNNLQQQKKGLMQKLLTGEVRVKIN